MIGYKFITLSDSAYTFDAVGTEKTLNFSGIKNCKIVFVKIGMAKAGESGTGTSYTETTLIFSDYDGRHIESNGFCINTSDNWKILGGVSVNFVTGDVTYQVVSVSGWSSEQFVIKRIFGIT